MSDWWTRSSLDLGSRHQVTTRVSHAQILTWPSIPIVLLPATESLAYANWPNLLPIPTLLTMILEFRNGGYSGLGTAPYWVVAWGSDWSMDLSPHHVFGQSVFNTATRSVVTMNVSPPEDHFEIAGEGQLLDNALALALSNDDADAFFTEGHESNYIDIVTAYSLLDLRTRQYV